MNKVKKFKSAIVVYCLLLVSLSAIFTTTNILVDNAKADSGWWDSNWSYSKKITINHNKIDADLTNFPLMIHLNSSVINNCQPNGEDIRFINKVNTSEFAYEIESWNSTDAYIWVNVTNVFSTTDTIFNMYYNNSGASDGQNITGVWGSNFIMVQHMKDNTTSDILDSTSYNNDGTKKTANEPIENTSSKINSGQDFDGGDDYINCGNDLSLNITDAMTIEAWVKAVFPPITSIVIMGFGQTRVVGKNGAGFGFYQGNKIIVGVGGPHIPVFVLNEWVDNEWNHIVISYDNDRNPTLYFNGQNVTTTSGTNYWTWNTDDNFIGKRPTGNHFNGTIDEVRISNISRSSAWIKASFNTQNQTTGFLTFGSKQVPSTAPDTPIGLAPSGRILSTIDGNVNINCTVTDPDGDSMTVYFYNNDTKVEIGNNTGVTNGSTSIVWSGLSNGSTYNFYTKSNDNRLNSSNSSVCTFTINNQPRASGIMIDNQTNPTHITDATPYFNWTYSDDDSDIQSKYQIMVGTSQGASDMWNPGAVTSTANNVIYGGSSLSRGIKYYVQVRVNDNYEWSIYNQSTFQLNQIPNAPSNPLCEGSINPTRILTLIPTFSWTFNPQDGGDIQGGFNIIVGASENDDSLWNQTTATAIASVVYNGNTLSRGTTYHWKVKTNDTYESIMGAYCVDQTFKINLCPTASLSSPSNQSTSVSLTPILNWDYSDADSDTQSNYHIQLDDNIDFSSTIVNQNVTSSISQYTVVNLLTNNTKYYWHVKVKDGNEWSNWQGTWEFTTTNITVSDLTTYDISYVETSNFNVGDKVVIQYNVTNIENMNNTCITIKDPLGTKQVDHEGVASVQENFMNDNRWDPNDATKWNIVGERLQQGAGGGSSSYNDYTLIKESVLANQVNLTMKCNVMVDASNEDMERLIFRWVDNGNFSAAFISETYSVVGIEECIDGVKYKEEAGHLFSEDTWYTLKVSVYGDSATVYVNGVEEVTKDLSRACSGRMGLGADTGWIYYDNFSIGYNASRVVGAITDGYQYEFNYTIPINLGTWNIIAYAESGGQASSTTGTFDVLSESPLIKNITKYNSTYVETNSFLGGDQVTIRVWVVDFDGRDALTKCNITLKNSLDTMKIDNVTMVDIGNITNGNIYEYNYTIPQEIASDGTWNITIYTEDNESHHTFGYDSFTCEVGVPSITAIKTYNSVLTEETVFSLEEDIKIRATVTDINGRDNITQCNITINSPSGTAIVTNVTMTDIANVTNGNVYNYDYILPSTADKYGTWSITIRTNDFFYNTADVSHFVLVWADTDYYHRQNISLEEFFGIDRIHEPLGFNISLPSSVCGGNDTIKIVNEKGETMPFKIQKKDGDNYYINYVSNISSDSLLDYYIYYNQTGSVPSQYINYDTAMYNNLTVSEANYTQIYDPYSMNITYGKSIVVGDLDNDGEQEIIVCGRTGPTRKNKAFLSIYNTTFIDEDEITLSLETYKEWNDSGSGEGFGYSVTLSDVDSDSEIEIVTAGVVYDGIRNKAQLVIWNYTGGILTEEINDTWYDDTAGETALYGVLCSDVDNDGEIEILTVGITGTDDARSQLAIHNCSDGSIKHEYFRNYSLDITYNWSELYGLAIGDVYNEGDAYPEIVVVGEGYDSTKKINAWFMLFRYNGSSYVEDWTKNWYDGELTELFSVDIGDVDNDGDNEIVTSGNYFDGTRDVAMYHVWYCTGAGYPKILHEDEVAEQNWYTYGYSSALTTLVDDCDNDGLIEIVTVGFQNDGTLDRGDYKIRSYNGTSTVDKHSKLWIASKSRRSGDFYDAVKLYDLNNDGFKELIDTGRYQLTPPTGTFVRVQSIGGVSQTIGNEDVLPPQSPNNLMATSHNNSRINMSWTKADDANNTLIIYKKGSNPTGITDGIEVYNGTGTTVSITGLDVGTLYYFSAWSWREGSSAYSDTYNITDEYTNPGDSTGLSATVFNSTQIDLTWTKGINATHTHIRQNNSAYPTTVSSGAFVYNGTISSTSDVDLTPVTTYYYSAWAYDSNSGYWSEGYDTDSDTTLLSVPVVVTNVSTGVKETNATLYGHINYDGGETSYAGFYYDINSGCETNNISALGTYTTGQEFSKEAIGLTKGELYYFTAWANNSAGFTKADNEFKFLTKPESPSSLGGIIAYNSIYIIWNEASCGSGETVGTRVQYKIGSSPTTISDGINAYNGTIESKTVSGLDDNTHYYFSAWSWVSAVSGEFQWSDTYDTFNAWTTPSPPSNFAITNITTNQLNITWTKGTGDYTLILRNESGWDSYPSSVTNGTEIYNGTGELYSDDSLIQGVTYYYSAWTYNLTTSIYSLPHATGSKQVAVASLCVSNPYPQNLSTEISRPPVNLSIQVNGTNIDMYIYFFNMTPLVDTWTLVQNWSGEGSGRFEVINLDSFGIGTEFIWGNTTYNWSVNVTDGSIWDNETYNYTTEVAVLGKNARYDVDNNFNINTFDLSVDWSYRSGPYDGLYDVNDDTSINAFDLSVIWSNAT